MRLSVDYGKPDAVPVRNSYPLPRMDECIDSLSDSTLFTTLDCNRGYWQVEIAGEDHDKTTLASHSCLYCFLRMPLRSQKRARDISTSGRHHPVLREMGDRAGLPR